MPMAAAGVVKLGDDMIQLAAAVAAVVTNNIMSLAAAATVAKRATNCVCPRRCR